MGNHSLLPISESTNTACGRRRALEHVTQTSTFELDGTVNRFSVALERAAAQTVLNEFEREPLRRVLCGVDTHIRTVRDLRVVTTRLESLARLTCEHDQCVDAARQANRVLERAGRLRGMLRILSAACDNALSTACEQAGKIHSDPLLTESRAIAQDLGKALQATNKVAALLRP